MRYKYIILFYKSFDNLQHDIHWNSCRQNITNTSNNIAAICKRKQHSISCSSTGVIKEVASSLYDLIFVITWVGISDC